MLEDTSAPQSQFTAETELLGSQESNDAPAVRAEREQQRRSRRRRFWLVGCAVVCIVVGLALLPKGRSDTRVVEDAPATPTPVPLILEGTERKLADLQSELDRIDPTRSELGLPPVDYRVVLEEL